MALSLIEYEERIKDKISLSIQNVTQEELDTLNRILLTDLKPAFIEDVETCLWNEKKAKRKLKCENITNTNYQNQYGLDYKRKENPLFIMGINECYKELEKDNLRIILYNRAGLQYCLGDSLLLLCLEKNIPIIPLRLDKNTLFSYTTESTKPITIRTTCLGITKKNIQSRSVQSDLIFLEQYYLSHPHLSWKFLSPEPKLINPSLSIQSHHKHHSIIVDREKVRHQSRFSRCDIQQWISTKKDLSWISSLPEEKKKEEVILLKKRNLEKLKEIERKENQELSKEIEVENKKEYNKDAIEPPKEIEDKKNTTIKKPTTSLKDRLKRNPLFRFKYKCLLNKHDNSPFLYKLHPYMDIHL